MLKIVYGDPAVIKAEREKRAGQAPLTDTEKKQRARRKQFVRSVNHVAVLDMETDPFDNVGKGGVFPFLAVLYSNNFDPIIIWEENFQTFVDRVVSTIEALPDEYTIYAHNGGKFDFLFLISRIRGQVSFKGRGIMVAKIGRHELRDSFHLIPEKLASYSKDVFDYENMRHDKRGIHKQAIIDYCVNDCKYLLDILQTFLNEFGFKISIGQAALAELKKKHKFDKLDGMRDADVRRYLYGGRVECLQGKGVFQGPFKLYDVNSMYPAVMANYRHPVGADYVTRPGEPGELTAFVDLNCVNHGALVGRDAEGNTTAETREGRFLTTIHEYRVALKYGLIEDVTINFVMDCDKWTDFRAFIEPMYQRRQVFKAKLQSLAARGSQETREYMETKKDDMFMKFLLNNAWGKMAQNPRRYKEHYLTDPGQTPPEEFEGRAELPTEECDGYWIWERPNPTPRFNNVGTGASITGAARSVLLEAIQNAVDPIYCDTDSLICRELHNTELHPTTLGAWDLEAEFSEVIVAGKKMYGCAPLKGGKAKVKSKGVNGLEYEELRAMVLRDVVLKKTNFGPTLTKTGSQNYITRSVRATAQPRKNGYGNRQQTGNPAPLGAKA